VRFLGAPGKNARFGIETDEKEFVVDMARIQETRKRFSRKLGFVAAHRTGQIENNADGDRAILTTEEADLLSDLIVIDLKTLSHESRNILSVRVCDCASKRDKIGSNDNSRITIAILLDCSGNLVLGKQKWRAGKKRDSENQAASKPPEGGAAMMDSHETRVF
jgi:hypothetical protein